MGKKCEVFVGIDLSINSTGIVVYKGSSTTYYIITSKLTKKQEKCDYINYLMYQKGDVENGDYSAKESIKTSNISKIVGEIENIILSYGRICNIAIEGVAFGANGDVVGLSGLNYIVRYMLIKHNIPFTIVSPMQLKKFATGNGGAEKDIMVDAFMKCTQFKNPLGVKVDDIADAYFLCMYAKDAK